VAERQADVGADLRDGLDPGGLTGEDSVAIAKALKAVGCDLVDVSTGQTTPLRSPCYGRMYQLVFAEQIRNEAGIATMAVGAITTAIR